MKLLPKVLILGSLFLISMGIWGRVHVVISANLILKIMGGIGILAGISLLLNDQPSRRR